MENIKLDKEWIEECKKWVFFDRSRFTNYKVEIEILDQNNNVEILIDWIKEKIEDSSPMTSLAKLGISCIYQQILARYI